MDVIMTVLTFFIIVSMTLRSEQGTVNVTLPSAGAGVSKQNTPDPLVVSLNEQEQIFLGNEPISDAQLAQSIKAYLQQNSQGSVLLRADKKLAYEKVVQLLGKMRDIGGDRVSLAIDGKW